MAVQKTVVDESTAKFARQMSEIARQFADGRLNHDHLQAVIEHRDVFGARCETDGNLISRSVTPNRTRSPQEALAATGRKRYVTDSVVKTMPKGVGETVEVVFFSVGTYISNDQLEKEYEKRGLTPTDPYSLCAVNEADPSFADTRPNCTVWKNAKGEWCYAAFVRWDGERYVFVNQVSNDWYVDWWFAGSRKLSAET